MLFSTQNEELISRFGVHKANEILMDAGYPAIDMSFFMGINKYVFEDDYKNTAEELKTAASARGVIFNQAHAPFGGGYDNYTKNLVPKIPRVMEFAALLGIKNIIVHPLQNGRYYGNEKNLFDMNVEFYKKLGVFAKEYGVKIAIENMWQHHPVNGVIVDDICADPHELAALYDALDDSDAFTVCLDIGHVALCGREPQDAVKIIGHDRLGALHVHDVDYVRDCHTLPGMQKINWDGVCRALGEINYVGEFTLEADCFLTKLDDALIPSAVKFMADTARYLANKIDNYRK